MALGEEAHDMIDTIVRTPDDEEAFRAGYTAALAEEVSIIGRTNRKLEAIIRGMDVTSTWLEDVETIDESIAVDNPSFVFGAVVAALSTTAGRADVLPPSEA